MGGAGARGRAGAQSRHDQEYAGPLSSILPTSDSHVLALQGLMHLCRLVQDAGTRRMLMYHDATMPMLEFGIFLTHRLGVFEPPTGPTVQGSAGTGPAQGRPLLRYQGSRQRLAFLYMGCRGGGGRMRTSSR